MMIEIAGRLIAARRVLSAEVETRHYMNGSSSFLLVKLDGGESILQEHGFGFDAFATLDRIRQLE